MGFGHRIYKNYDPRARIIKRVAYEVFDMMGRNPLLEIALEWNASRSKTIISFRGAVSQRGFLYGLLPVDGLPHDDVSRSLRHPRTSGWIAQWEEMLLDPEQKIARPRQVYFGL